MSSTSVILKDESTLSQVDQLFFKVESWLNLTGGLIIFSLVLLTVTNVLGRWIFNLPVSGYIDWIEQSMAFFAFLGIAYCQRLGGHIRMDILVNLLTVRTHWVSELISTTLMFGVTLLLVYGSYLHAWRAYSLGDSSMDINLPTWPAKLVVPLALSFLALRLLLQIWATIRALIKGHRNPVALPLAEDTMEKALHEVGIMLDPEKKPPSV
jgi:C4-dicarboxylate transporter DctQ subunit